MKTSKRTFSIGPGVECDIDRLISTRLLVQANSGGGKSWVLRRLLEQTHGKVQQIVIDPEGEFASLREKFDYVLAARQGGDTLADPRTAKLLAERLLELGVSAIVDIYELYPKERVHFVKLFCEALVNAPKALWHPALIVLDEAHIYCPEKEEAESATAVNALCSLGRKRGFCAVLATQRISKLAKDAAAECNNKLTGRTSLDVDMKRASEDLGFNTKEEKLSLRDLEDGEFFVYGPALTKTVTRVKVGSVQTTHPKAGSHLAAVVPPPTDKVKALLPKLSDLPAEAEAREKTVADLKKDLATVRRELTEARKAQPPAPKAVEPKRVEVLTDSNRALLEKVAERLADQQRQLTGNVSFDVNDLLADIDKRIALFKQDIHNEQSDARDRFMALLDSKGFQKILEKLAAVQPPHHTPATMTQRVDRQLPVSSQGRRVAPVAATNRPASLVSHEGITKAEQRVLDAVAWWHAANIAEPTRLQVAMVARYTVNGHFNNLVGGLRTKGLVDYPSSGGVMLTGDGHMAANLPDGELTRAELIARVMQVLRTESLQRIFRAVVDSGCAISREELAALTNYTVNGHFNNMVGSLRSLGVIDYPTRGGVQLGEMFEALS